MTDFLDRLELQLIETVERYAPGRAQAPESSPRASRRGRGWRERLGLRRRPLAIGIAVLVLGGSAAAAVLSLTPSRPLSGTIAGGGPQAPIPAGVARYRITAFPYLAVGWTGWCTDLTLINGRGQTSSDYSCGPVEKGSDPLLTGQGVGTYEFELFTDKVAAVRFSYGRTFRPVSDPDLPPGTSGIFVVNPPISGRSHWRQWTETWLNAQGHQISQPLITRAKAVEHLPLESVDPRHPGDRPCAVSVNRASGASPIAETVSTVKPWPRRMVGALESCSNATFRIRGGVLATAVLINASDPLAASPPLSELTPDTRRPGLLTGSGLGSIGFPQGVAAGVQGFTFNDEPYAFLPEIQPQAGAPIGVHALTDHDVTARRAGNAWLIAEGGTAAQRATLLAAATVIPAGRR